MSDNPPDIVLIHDGARPWVSEKLIKEVINATVKHEACIPVIEQPDTPKLVGNSGFIIKHLKRNRILGAQTPQGFSYDKIFRAHQIASKRGKYNFADDSEIFNLYFHPVYTIPGERNNKKITYPEDLKEVL